MPTQPYAYQSEQASLLKPYYQRWLWDGILKALPVWLSPNAMTVIGTLCCAASFVIAITLNQSPAALLVAAVLIIAYLSLDNLDGAQARRLGKSSRLGEFLDHWLDTLNNGFVVIGACVAADLPPMLTLAVLCCGTVAFFAVQWELRNTGVFRMGRIADIEGNTSVALLYVGLAVFGREAFQIQLLPGLPTGATLLGCGVIAQALWTSFTAARQAPERLHEFAPLVAASGALYLWAGLGDASPVAFLTAAFFLNPVFTSGPIRQRLQLGRMSSSVDWTVAGGIGAAALLALFGALGAFYGELVVVGVIVSLAALTLRYFVASLVKLNAKHIPESAPSSSVP